MKKIFFVSITLFFIGVILFPHIGFAQYNNNYTPLAPIPGYVEGPVQTNSLNDYLNNMFKLGIAVAGALAVVMIILGGIQYMSTDAIGKKEEGKKRIAAAVTGLVVALGSYMLLNTLSADFLSTKLTLNDPLEIVRLTPGSGDSRINPETGSALNAGAVEVGSPDYPYSPSDPRYGQVAAAREIIPKLPPAPQPTGTSTPGTCADKILESAQYSADTSHPLNTCAVPGTNGGSRACAYAVNEIVENGSGQPITNSLGTADMNTTLQSSSRFTFIGNNVSQAQPGDIIISPTQGSNTGHVGVCETAGCGTIISNSSRDAKVERNFTGTAWTNYYGGKKNLPVNIYRPNGDC